MICFDNNNINFISCGHFKSMGQWIHSTRCLDTMEIIFVTQGTIYIEQDNIKYELKKGDTLLLKQGITHGGYQPSIENVMFYWVHFTVSDFDALNINELANYQVNEQRFSMAFQNLLHVVNSTTYNPTVYDLCTLMIIEELLSYQKIQNKNSRILFNEITEYIRHNIKTKLTVLNIATHFGYNEEYISSIFKKEYAVGLKSYINTERINAIKNVITSTNYNIKEIAFSYGFDGLNEFVKYFKYHTGVSPTKYRGSFWHTHINVV